MKLTIALTFIAGILMGWALYGLAVLDGPIFFGCWAASGLTLVAAYAARPKALPDQKARDILSGLRIVGREGKR